MEVKKSKKADLENKKSLLTEIGLVIALTLVIVIFSVSQQEKVIEIMDLGTVADEVDFIDVTVEKEPEIIPQQEHQTVAVIADILNVVKNDTKITTTIDFLEDFDTDLTNVTTFDTEVEEVIVEDTPVLVAEKSPAFQGGTLNDFRNWVQSRLEYPALALENNISGRVVVTFVIEKNGKLSNPQVVSSPDKLLSDEVLRVVKLSPPWSPAYNRDQPVRFRYNLPLEFKIQN